VNRSSTSPVEIRDQLIRLMEADLRDGLKRLFAQVEQQPLDLAANESDREQHEAHQAIAYARDQQDRFYHELCQKLLSPERTAQAIAQAAAQDWHVLIGDRSRALRFEDALAQATRLCGNEHAQFEARIGQLHSDDPEAVPAGLYTMEAISRVFVALTRDLPENLRHRLVDQWPEQVLVRLVPTYSVLNDYLIQAGVVPGIKRLHDPLANLQLPVQPTSPPDEPDVPQHAGPTIDALAERLVPLVRTTLGGDSHYLFRFERDQDWHSEDFAAFIMERLEPALPPSNWPTRTRKLIQWVGLAFSELLNDDSIDPRHRRQIATLQPAVLLLASQDRHFLSDADHPGRQILNLMALIGTDPDLKPDIDATAALLAPIQEAIVNVPERLERWEQLERLVGQLRAISRSKPKPKSKSKSKSKSIVLDDNRPTPATMSPTSAVAEPAQAIDPISDVAAVAESSLMPENEVPATGASVVDPDNHPDSSPTLSAAPGQSGPPETSASPGAPQAGAEAENPASEQPNAPASTSSTASDGLLLASLDFIQDFFQQQASSQEWFEVDTGPRRALRRLKIHDLDRENGMVNFANHIGQVRLSLPVDQVIDDLIKKRTRLVFDNPHFARAFEQLRDQLEARRHEH